MKTFLFIIFIGLSSNAYTYKYCVPANKIDFSPYREILDGKDILYIIPIFTPFMSSDSGLESILEAYEFSPNGQIFKGRISKSIKWSDGKNVDSLDFVNSFEKILPFRPIGSRLKIRKYRIIDNLNFEIIFSSSSENITGILTEALIAGSRQNRFWMYENKNKYVARQGIKINLKKNIIEYDKKIIELVDEKRCKGADFGVFPKLLNANENEYLISRPSNPQAVTAVFNTNFSYDRRKKLAQLLMNVFSDENLPKNIYQVFSFFKMGEVGFHNINYWKDLKVEKNSDERFKIFYEIPVFKEIVQNICKNCIFISEGDLKNADVQLLSSYIPSGRHVILQDLLKWNYVDYFLKKSKLTKELLKQIANNSDSTHINNGEILKNFEIASKNEISVLPLARREIWAYSKRNAPIKLMWNSGGDIVFYKK